MHLHLSLERYLLLRELVNHFNVGFERKAGPEYLSLLIKNSRILARQMQRIEFGNDVICGLLARRLRSLGVLLEARQLDR